MAFSALCSQGPAKTAGLDSFREPLGENYYQARSACWQNLVLCACRTEVVNPLPAGGWRCSQLLEAVPRLWLIFLHPQSHQLPVEFFSFFQSL